MKIFELDWSKEFRADTAILDGELVVTDHLGRTMFVDLMKQRKLARYFLPSIWYRSMEKT
jgi:ATP-dependent DNA ligase